MSKTFRLSTRMARQTAEVVRRVRRQPLSTIGDDSGLDFDKDHWFWGITVADAFEDERYTVQRARPTNDGDAATAVPTFEAFPSDHEYFLEVTARNTLERGTHVVPAGTPVVIWWDYDSTTDPRPQPRYWFEGDPIGNPQYQGMGIFGVAQNQRGWMFPPAHAFDDPE